MSIEVRLLDKFRRDFKRLSRKFRSLTGEVGKLINDLEVNPKQGVDMGVGLHKIRLASTSKRKGKSGGFRVVTYYIEQVGDEEIVYLVTIYDKSEQENITKDDLLAIIDDAFGE